jgi:pimeloyl-ACP methyl ester carboxylesterase
MYAKIKWIVILVLGVIVVGCGEPDQAPTPYPPTPTPRPPLPMPTPVAYPAFEPGNCPGQISTSVPHDCGHLLVLEDRGNPNGREVRLPVVIFRSANPNPEPDPLIYLPEGGGHSQIHDYERLLDTLGRDVLEQRDLIVYNQRGSELTFPHFFCDKYSEFLWEINGKSWSGIEHNLAVMVFWRTCYERLEERALNLNMYDSAANAADANDLRLALGLDQANYYATSYGTRIGLDLIRDYPDGVRSLIVDSVHPLQADYYGERAANAQRAFEALFETCADDVYCNEHYPDLRERFFQAVDLLGRRPVYVRYRRGPLAIDGETLLEALYTSLGSSEMIPRIPQIIYEAADGDLTSLEAIILDNLNAAHRNPALVYTALCREELPFANYEDVSAQAGSVPDQAISVPEQVTSFFGTSFADFYDRVCELWEVDAADPAENEAVVSEVPTLVLAGQFDPVSPPAWGRMAAETLENSYFYEIPGEGQGIMAANECGRSIGLSFLDDPTRAPDSSCLADLPPLDFESSLPAPRFEPSGCYFNYTPGTHQVECGYLVVPEDRSQPDGPTVKLHVAIFKSRAAHPAPDPVIYVAGGGGSNHLDSYQLYLENGGYEILRNRDYIMYNQRGAQYNHPMLQCPGYADLMRRQAWEGVPQEEREAQAIEFFAACYADLMAQGRNPVPYDSDDNAADLNDLRLALGYDQVNLYGTSYGTRIILGVLRDYPEGVRSAIIDSVYPPQVSLYVEYPHNAQRAFEAVLNDCAADPDCQAKYPNLRETFYQLVEELNADPVYVGTIWVGGNDFMDAIYFALYKEYAIPQVPKWIYQASHGDHSGLLWFYEVGIVDDNADRAVAHGVHNSLLCREEAPFNDPAEALALADRLHPVIQKWMGWPRAGQAICQAWPVGIADPIENQAVTSEVPTLIFAGRYDPITPPAWGRLAGETLSHSYFYEFPAIGHGVMRANECALEMGLQFIADPLAEPDSTCLAELTPPDFK